MQEAGVHLDPVTADVQGYQELPQEDPQGVEVAEAQDEASCGTAVRHHVKHSTKRSAYKKRRRQ